MAGDYVPDNGPLITGALWFICLICLPFPVARTYVRITRVKNLWWDDWALILPWVSMSLYDSTFTSMVAEYHETRSASLARLHLCKSQ